MTIRNYPQQIYQKEEGAVFYNWCRFYFQFPLWALLILSVIWPFLPDPWLASDWIYSVDSWFRANFEKLKFEGRAYDTLLPLWGTRYVSFTAICWSLVALTNAILIIPMIFLTWKFGHRLSYDQRSSSWKTILALMILGYLMFGQWMDLSNASPGHYAIFITRSWLIYPIAAAIASFLHVCCADLVILVTKILKFKGA